MSYQYPITIAQALYAIRNGKYLLPSIQRGVVWSHEQIERLFDSLMRDYPIGSFLFWRVEKEQVNNYQFYEFIREYHERDTVDNPPAAVSGQEEIIGVLDGQQRLTALYIGLQGSYAYKIPWKRWDNPAAFPKRRLYLNLLGQSGRDDLLYDFRFLTNEEAKEQGADKHWFKVGEILQWNTLDKVNQYLCSNNLHSPLESPSNLRTPSSMLTRLYEVVYMKPVINYYLETSQDLDKVLNIFIRVNSGGTQLSYSDLLLSIASASWKYRNARDEINNLVKEINDIGDKFNFDKDFVMKASLVLCDFTNIAFNARNFNKDNMTIIENKWDKIAGAIRAAVHIVSSIGFNRDTLPANNAVIPIAYYAYKRGITDQKACDGYIHSLASASDLRNIQKWLSICLLKRTFSGQIDSILTSMREVIRNHIEVQRAADFPFDAIVAKFKGTPKSLVFTDDEIENLLNYTYGQAYTFSVLALLYPTLDYRNKFHVDHIHPKSVFAPKNLNSMGLAPEYIQYYQSNRDKLPNLQLLEGLYNLQKSSSSLIDWLERVCADPVARDAYLRKHYIPTNINLEFKNFPQFFEERKKLMADKLRRILSF
ncbi:uncharacterized protein with ParB-like and HNH nuclease domain [Desulfofundulus luciae]|uniref:Uncharacterized protein with ParB-like and HNH nuclease domain n=1 Tax=Desulfofundulus luciae TaxID=74702 RepID=A0ABU0B278_9FIRM|nr:DUF262 domain-containing protein [Desulfofundulus luciae]MDQ0286815.1 uncharacterized protein with ParB-like and HNH nuclease domain [Desulfofundulus luciae]